MKIRQGTVRQVAEKVTGKKNLYCFGAGIALKRFLADFEEYHLEASIRFIVDNSEEKQGKLVRCNEVDILIVSPEQMLNEITSEDIILITTAKFSEIISQLNQQEKLDNTECYLHTVLRIEQYDSDRLNIQIPSKLSVYREAKIPKTIHYCWFGKKEMPSQYKEWIRSWKKHCPNYEIIEWNEDNYDVRKSRYASQAYDLKKWAFVADYARIDIINECGGVYLDTDVELVKNIDVLLMNDAFCGFESSQYVAYGLGFGSKKCNPVLSEIKEHYDNMDFVSCDGKLNQITCPVIQTEIMRKHGLECNGKFQIVDGMVVYPSRILCGMSPHSYRVERNLTAYAIHHFAASWVEDKKGKRDIISYMKKWGMNDNYFYPDF